MRAGALDRQIELRHVTLTRDATTGEESKSWPAAYATVWASKRDVRGREFFAAQQMNAELTTVWQIRYRADVKRTDQIVADGAVYNIVGISEIGRRVGLEIQTTAAQQ